MSEWGRPEKEPTNRKPKVLSERAIHNRHPIIDCYILFHLTHIIILPLYRDFVKVCGNAINLNELLIKTDQQAYHEDMKERYEVLKTKVAGYVGSVCYSLYFTVNF